MNLTEQTINNTNQINITDSLNSSAMELKIKRTSSSNTPESNDLIVYVDQTNKENPSESRKQYVYDLLKPLDYYENVSDEFIMKFTIQNSKVVMETVIKRLIGENEDGKYLLADPAYEVLENTPIILFAGTNYIYTNYDDTDITLIYPKDNEFNKLYLNNAIYVRDNEDREECTLADIYYSNCFTKTENRIDLEIGHITADCISSNNNKFSLDDEGNLLVKTITVADPISSTDLASIYPIGSIYMNVSNVDPATLFGGTWEQIKGRFLFATGAPEDNTINTFGTDLTYNGEDKINATLGSTGGETFHTLTINQMPSHTHIQYAHKHTWKGRKAEWGNLSNGNAKTLVDSTSTSSFLACGVVNNNGVGSTTATNKNTGGGASHSNMPPYLVVNMWKRVA